jgi:hypothetical protein
MIGYQTMRLSRGDLLEETELIIPTLGGRSKITFKFYNDHIMVTNSRGRETSFSWLNLDTVSKYCDDNGYLLKTKHYNPMNNSLLPESYPKNKDALSLVSLAHYMAGKHK